VGIIYIEGKNRKGVLVSVITSAVISAVIAEIRVSKIEVPQTSALMSLLKSSMSEIRCRRNFARGLMERWRVLIIRPIKTAYTV
jgi:hypothetical protein